MHYNYEKTLPKRVFEDPYKDYTKVHAPKVLSFIENSDEVVEFIDKLKRQYDLKSFGLWSKDIPDINKLEVGDIIHLPHYVGLREYARGDKYAGSVDLKVKELRTVTETKVVESSNGSKRTHKSSRKVVGLEYHSGTKFYDLFRSSKRRRHGSYYRTNDKVTIWLTQQKLFNLFLMDGGLCPLKREEKDCFLCDK